jgi:hypothetical protein
MIKHDRLDVEETICHILGIVLMLCGDITCNPMWPKMMWTNGIIVDDVPKQCPKRKKLMIWWPPCVKSKNILEIKRFTQAGCAGGFDWMAWWDNKVWSNLPKLDEVSFVNEEHGSYLGTIVRMNYLNDKIRINDIWDNYWVGEPLLNDT